MATAVAPNPYQPYSFGQASQALQGAYGNAYGSLGTQYQQLQTQGLAALNQAGLGNTTAMSGVATGFFNAYSQARANLLAQQQQQALQTGMAFNQLGIQQQNVNQGWAQIANQANAQQAQQQLAQQNQAFQQQQANQAQANYNQNPANQAWFPGSYPSQTAAAMMGNQDSSLFG